MEKRTINYFHDSQLKFYSKAFNPQKYLYVLAAVCDALEMHPVSCRRLRFDLQNRCGVKVLLISGSRCSVNAFMTCLFSGVLIASWALVKGNRNKILLSIEQTKWKKVFSLSVSSMQRQVEHHKWAVVLQEMIRSDFGGWQLWHLILNSKRGEIHVILINCISFHIIL